MSAESREQWSRDRQQRMERAIDEGEATLTRPENDWMRRAISHYLDVKDWASGTRLSDLTPWTRSAFRAIRQGSGGLLGNPPIF